MAPMHCLKLPCVRNSYITPRQTAVQPQLYKLLYTLCSSAGMGAVTAMLLLLVTLLAVQVAGGADLL